MIQRLIALFFIQLLLIAGPVAAAPATGPAKPASADKPITSQPAAQPRKTPEARFIEGLACLKKADIPCAQVAQAGIPSTSPYAKLLAGDIAAAQKDFDLAFRLLLPLQAESGLLPAASASLHASLALAYDNQPDPLRALEQRTLVETDLTEAADIQANQQQIWASISKLPREQLVEIRGDSLDTTIQGWIDLALAVQAGQSLADWRSAYPDHPAGNSLLQELGAESATPTTPVARAGGLHGKIALLLPFEVETYYPVSDAIEQGFAAAKTIAKDDSEIQIYPTRGNKDEITAIYQQAVNEGAKYVIGPLTRDEITTLARHKAPVTTLALNEPDQDTSQENLYSFGLSIDDEATQIANIARNYGMQNAIIVATDGPISTHMAHAFNDAWIAQDGSIVLRIDINEKTDLTALKAQITSHPADMILLAGNAEEARNIRPYLDAATATFGFSHVYAGINHDPMDAPLTAIRFIDLPWLLNRDNAAFSAYKSEAADLPQGEMQRWFALGADSYQVLLALAQHKATTLHGLSGRISISETGEITRELSLGSFGNNGIVLEKSP